MAQHNVTLKDGRKAIIDTAGAQKGTTHILCAVENGTFQRISKSKIAPSRQPRHIGTLGELLYAAAS